MNLLERRIDTLFGRVDGRALLHRDDRALIAMQRGTLEAPFRVPTDLRWSRDGKRLACAAGELVVFSRGEAPTPSVVYAENVAGSVRLVARNFEGIDARARPDDVLSADFVDDTTMATLRADGVIKVGTGTVATVPHARWLRVLARGQRLAVVVETPDEPSELRIVDRQGTLVAKASGLLTLGGVAISPDGERLAVRDAAGVRLLDLSGEILRTIPVTSETPAGERVSGRLAWSRTALVALDGRNVVVIDPQGGVVKTIAVATPEHPLVSLAVTSDARFAVVTSMDQKDGMHVVDLHGGSAMAVPWATFFHADSPIVFSPTDDVLAFGNALAALTMVPWGDVLEDPQRVRLGELWAFVRGGPGVAAKAPSASDAEIRAVIDEISATRFRPALLGDASSLRSALETILETRQRAATQAAIYRPIDLPPFAVGEKVVHPKFGVAKVTAVDGAGETARITAKFEDGPRTLRASFLKRA